MGAFSSQFAKNQQEAKIILTPNQGDFITGHADLTGLAVVEVQRFWARYKQLGCDKNSNLSRKALEQPQLTQDSFVKNIIADLPKEKDGSLSFIVFLKFMHWLEYAEDETKLRGLFHFLNNGNDLNFDVVFKFLKKLYPNNSEMEVRETCDIFMSQLDKNNTGFINENQFVANVKREFRPTELKELLNFDLIPVEVLDEVNMQPSLAGSRINLRNDNDYPLTIELTDEILEQVAIKAVKKDWEKLSIKLGYLEADLQKFKNKSKANKTKYIDPDTPKDYETLLDILTSWRDQDPYLATKSRLTRYLLDTNMPEAAALLV